MATTTGRTRLAAGLFGLIALAITGNVLLMQGDASVRAAERTKAERAQERTEKERQKRLALKAGESAQPAAAAPAAPRSRTSGAEPTPAQIERVGRFAPSAAQLSGARIPESDAEARGLETVRAVQRGLVERGYEPGAPDGVVGLATRAAVMAYEHDNGLPLTADPSDQVLLHMQTGQVTAAPRTGKPGRAPLAEQVIRSVQQSLSMLGYFAGRIDGFAGDDTVRAVREYEMDQGLVPTGRVSAPLVVRLQRATATAAPRGARP